MLSSRRLTEGAKDSYWSLLYRTMTAGSLTMLVSMSAVCDQAGATPPQAQYASAMRGYTALLDTTTRPVTSAAQDAFRRFMIETNMPWQAEWNGHTGLVKTLRGGRLRGRGGSMEEVAVDLIQSHLELFLPVDSTQANPRPEFKAVWKNQRGVRLAQYSQGLQVFRSNVGFGFNSDGTVYMIDASVWPIPTIKTTPTLTPLQATQAVRDAKSKYVVAGMTIDENPPVVILPSNPPRLMYSVEVRLGPHFLVDAQTGEVLLVSTRMHVDEFSPPLPDSAKQSPSGGTPSENGAPPPPGNEEDTLRGAFRFSDQPGVIFFGTMRDTSDFRDSEVGRAMARQSPTEFRKTDSLLTCRFLQRLQRPPQAVPQPPRPKNLLPIVLRLFDSTGIVTKPGTLEQAKDPAAFYVDYMRFTAQNDQDGDGFARNALLQLDVDATLPGENAVVYADIYIRNEQGVQQYLLRTGQFPVVGQDDDYYTVAIDALAHGRWDFRCEVYRYDGAFLTAAPFGLFPSATDVPFETGSEDAVYYLNAFAADTGNDHNGNGYFSTWVLEWDVDVNEGTHRVYSDLWISPDGTLDEHLFMTPSYQIADFAPEWQALLIAGRPHGNYFARMRLFEEGTNRLLGETFYGEYPEWSFFLLETGEEDKGPTQVFDPNPVNALDDHCLWDQDNARSAVPLSAYEVVQLPLLNPPPYDDGFYQLSGPYANIKDIFPPVVPSPIMPGPSYAYYRDEAGFEATMAYYHITRNEEYIQSLALGYPIGEYQFDVDVFGNVPGASPGATSAYIGDPPGRGYLLFGYNWVDHAEDADVILHEYGHAILDNMAPGVFPDDSIVDDDYVMAEGFSQYWAASSTQPQSVAHGFPPEFVGEWVVKNNPSCSPLHLPDGDLDKIFTYDSMLAQVLDPHLRGQLWSCALWDILQSIGRTAADPVILDGHGLAATLSDPAFGTVVDLLLRSDTLLFGGGHTHQIAAPFCNRRITCRCHANPACDDTVVSVRDVVATVSVAFRNSQAVRDPGCLWMNSNVNCDNVVDVLDVVRTVSVAFRGGDPAAQFCNPCL